MKVIWLVIPCYNEEEVLPETSQQLEKIMVRLIDEKKISPMSRIAFVNDGSKDETWKIITSLHERSELFSGINLSRNRGHQNALLAGLMTSKKYADAVISLDADLQDDVHVIEAFIDKYEAGNEIVYGVRSARDTDTFFKRGTAQAFYKLMRKMGVEMIADHADYRLMSRRALDELENFKEVNLFLRGMIPMIGFKTDIVTYERHERFAGTSKYPLKKMIAFAIDGITSLSIKPIRLITTMGIFIFSLSILVLIYFCILHMIGRTVQGWSTIVISVWAIGGLQLLSIGVIGEYIGKIYLETKARPRFIISEMLNKEEK